MTHSAKEYVRGDVTHQFAEGYFSIFKRGMRGIYQHCKEKHLHRYLAEYDFRYNHRVALGYSDMDRTLAAIKGETASASRTGNLTKRDFSHEATRIRRALIRHLRRRKRNSEQTPNHVKIVAPWCW